MNRRQISLAALAAAALTLAAFRIAGDPIASTSVGLDHDPEALIVASTNGRGVIDLQVPQGRVTGLLLPAVQSLRVPAVARVEMGRTVLISAPIQPGGRGKAYFVGRDGRKLTLTIPRGGARVRIILTEGPVAGTGPAEAAINTSRSNIKKPDNK